MRRTLTTVLAMAVTTACGGGDQRLVVFAASSLTDVMDQVEETFEAEHPGVDVVVNLGGSSSLVAQVADGAPADVVITADLVTMVRLQEADADLDVRSTALALNELVIAVESGNPQSIRALVDLARPDLVVVVAAPEVPAGAYAADALACAQVDLRPSSLEQSVRAVAAKVRLGEADAGIVYRTDVDERIEAVEIGPACQVRAEYAIATVGDEPLADEFVTEMTSGAGRAVLGAEGFALP